MCNPNEEIYGELTKAYEYFNRELFDNRLPACVIVMHRKKGAAGYFWADMWEDGSNKADELALNPDTLKARTTYEILSTLVHEQCHVEQFHFGTPSRNGYHNKEWGTMMERVGLIPSDTGAEGGKRTGQKMTHYEEIGGRFDLAVNELLEDGFSLDWFAKNTQAPKKAKGNSKTKYVCDSCDAKVWGKPDMFIGCMDCDTRYEEELK